MVEQKTGVLRVVGSSPTSGTNSFLPSVTSLVSEVIRVNAWLLNDQGGGSVVKYGWDKAHDHCLASSVGIAADWCTEGCGFESHVLKQPFPPICHFTFK